MSDPIAAIVTERIAAFTAELELARDYSPDARSKMAGKEAMDDGSFPIKSEKDLRNAIQAFGRAKDKAKAKAHIVSRAKALGLTKLLPDGWK